MKKISKYLTLFLLLLFFNVINVDADNLENSIQCSAHVQYNGWMSYVDNGEICGTVGASKRMESFIINKNISNVDGDVLYKSYVEGVGWQDYVSSGNISGTEGKSKRIEMIKIKLDGEMADKYDIYYRVHVQVFGWLDWAKNGQTTGTMGYDYRIEAIQVKLVLKGQSEFENVKNIYYEKPLDVIYCSHVQTFGWLPRVSSGDVSGTVGKSRRMEAFVVEKSNSLLTGDVLYRSYIEGIGWQDYVSSGKISGTEGKSKKIEMIQLKLTDQLADNYDIYYRVHVSYVGWMDWAKNDEVTGTFGYRRGIEAIQIKVVKKGSAAPGNTKNINLKNKISVKYQSYYDNKWQKVSSDGEVSGVEGNEFPIRGYKVTINDNSINDWIEYRSYVSGKGWQNYTSGNNISGVSNNNNYIELIQMRLSNEAKIYYNIYYRVYVKNIGWMDWALDDEVTGTLGYGYQIEAMEIRLLNKDEESLNKGNDVYKEKTDYLTYTTHMQNYGWLDSVYDSISGKPGNNVRMEAIKIRINNLTVNGGIRYSTHVQYNGWMNWIKDGGIAGTVGEAKRMEAIKIELTGDVADLYDIYYRTYVQDFGWLDWAKNGEMAGSSTIGKRMEGIQVKLVIKNGNAPGSTETPYLDSIFKTVNGKKYYYEKGKVVTGFKVINGIKYFFNSEGVLIKEKVKKVIDVSVYQGDINWTLVKNDGVDGAIIRLGYGTSYTTDSCVMDKKFERNYNAANNLGLVSGIYLYSYAIDEVSARKEANFVLEKLKKYNINKSIPIYYDLEENNWTKDLNASKYDKIITAFSNIIDGNGYKTRIYTYKFWAENKLSSAARNKLDWIAQYSNYCTYVGTYKGWQYTSSGRVSGINGDVDISVWFK